MLEIESGRMKNAVNRGARKDLKVGGGNIGYGLNGGSGRSRFVLGEGTIK